MKNGVPVIHEVLRDIYGYQITQLIAKSCEISLFDHLITPQSFEQLQILTDADPKILNGLLLFLQREHFISEISNNVFINTAKGNYLSTNHELSLKNIAIMHGDGYYWNCWQNIMSTLKTGQSASFSVFGTNSFSYFEQNESSFQKFNKSMEDWCSFDKHYLPKLYDFSHCKQVVDIGGGTGEILFSILANYPNLFGMLLDTEQSINLARKKFHGTSEYDRCHFEANDFFNYIPRSADIYLLRHILHNWDDNQVKKILNLCLHAMKPGSKLLVMDNVVGYCKSDLSHIKNMHMQVCFQSGKERTLEKFEHIFNDVGFKIIKLTPLPSQLTLLELTKKDIA